MEEKNPLVSVAVLCYNSSSTIIETLDSIYDQSYQNIELIVSDDCSTDNTVQICRDWIEIHKSRFFCVKLLTSEKNKGISHNYNRAFDACQGEWIKEIDGDDVLRPQALEKYVKYVIDHPNVNYVFAKMDYFGCSQLDYEDLKRLFDYSLFELSPKEQIHHLLFIGNWIPSPTSFYKRSKILEMGFRCDERVPYMEDWPKWINLLKAGIRFELMNEVLVDYRFGGISQSTPTPNAFRTGRLFWQYYQFPAWYAENPDEAIRRTMEYQCDIYNRFYKKHLDFLNVKKSYAYRIGKFIIKPLSKIIKRK